MGLRKAAFLYSLRNGDRTVNVKTEEKNRLPAERLTSQEEDCTFPEKQEK